MSTMVTELYDALISAGADEEKAREAARAVASQESFSTKDDIHRMDIRLIKWQIGVGLGIVGLIKLLG
uniref:Integrase, catalytic region n=1 Tax=Magnetococcus massalia (strain MO-1) TaxID=451514 RepID=A0A1S7LIY3_MAGMO